MIIKDIVEKLITITQLTPVVKGGNRSNPLEYSYYRISRYNYRLELWLHGEDMLELQELSDTIVDNLNNLGDINELNGSIELNGGGQFTEENRISKVMYFDVTEYPTYSRPTPPPPLPHFTLPFTLPIRW